MGMGRCKRKALKGRPMLRPFLEWTGQVRVPLQMVFRGRDHAMPVPWEKVNLPLRGVRFGERSQMFFKERGMMV